MSRLLASLITGCCAFQIRSVVPRSFSPSPLRDLFHDGLIIERGSDSIQHLGFAKDRHKFLYHPIPMIRCHAEHALNVRRIERDRSNRFRVNVVKCLITQIDIARRIGRVTETPFSQVECALTS